MALKDLFFKPLSTHKMASHFPLCLGVFVAKVFYEVKKRDFYYSIPFNKNNFDISKK